ncbi:MAG: hypothetical protein DRI69_09780 [Bacteroidetes bacterium]|nr:MAG: hypothetical protein DRI69_09780 [Bacteroidota bacterium]
MAEIKEGYDTPSDLKHTPKPWFGLSTRHALLGLVAIAIGVGWLKLTVALQLPSDIREFGFVVLGITAIGAVFLDLDMWMYHAIRWQFASYYVTRFDKAAKQVSGIIGVEGDHYWNMHGDVCAILRLTALNSNRVDPEKAQEVENADKEFLNSLPCPVQIVGYTYNYTLDKYMAAMLSYAADLPKKVMEYKISHLNFYQQYIREQNIRERSVYMIIKADSTLAEPIETLDIYVNIISKNLIRSGVIGRRLAGSEIQTTMVMIATGIGDEGLEYLTPYPEVESQ